MPKDFTFNYFGKKNFNKKAFFLNFIANLFFVYCVIVALALIMFSSVTIECEVDGTSMQPTLNCNWGDKNNDSDIVYVNKFDRDFEYGDIIVINAEENKDHIIKRVIGVAGDEIDVVERNIDGGKEYKLEINGKIIEEDYLKMDNTLIDVSKRDGNFSLFEKFNALKVSHPELFETRTIGGRVVEKLIVPDGEIFALGDNRHVSQDSTYYGTFSLSQIDGTVELVRYYGDSEFLFYWDYIVQGKFITTLINCLK